MKEDFLMFLWKYQYFSKSNLTGTQNESILILNQGSENLNAGPDFLHATLKINNILWHGNIEIHVNASDWFRHEHQYDPVYEQVILHVVWQNDKDIKRNDGSYIPALELKNLVEEKLISNYHELARSLENIPCHFYLPKVDYIVIENMITKVSLERLQRKGMQLADWFEQGYSWEEITYWALARNFGFKTNQEAFLRLARLIPLKLIFKHGNILADLEALFFGMSGLLNRKGLDQYAFDLKERFDFLAYKYRLSERVMNPGEWKFLRMRPSNFPSRRIAQFINLYHHRRNLFSAFISLNSRESFIDFFSLKLSDYWQAHYDFGKFSNSGNGEIGRSSVEMLIINTIVPIMVARGQILGEQKITNIGLELMESLASEKNRVTKKWETYKLKSKNAFESQGLNELYNQYCLQKKCLNCNIGNVLLRSV